MAVTPHGRVTFVQQRMREIVESPVYSAQEKRIRAMAQLERLLEALMVFLPPEQQQMAQAILKLYEQAWSSQ